MKKLRVSHLVFVLLSLSPLLCSRGSSLCVSRSHFGDEFVNVDGSLASCADRGASCAAGTSLGGVVARVSQRCNCEVNDELPCPACKCNYVRPLFNGTMCDSMRSVGWSPRDDLVQPNNVNYSQVIAIGKAFPYPTKIYAWKVRISNNRTSAGWLLIQTWRPKIGGFNLVNVTNFTYDTSRGNGYTNTEISMHEGGEIAVDRGDVIGLFLPRGIKGAPFGIGYADPSVGAASEDGSNLLFFETGNNLQPPTELTTVDYDEHVTQFVINIHAMIGPLEEGGKECTTPSTMRRVTTDSISTPSGSPNSPLDVEYIRLIVVPILIILLFLIFLAIGIGVIVLCVRFCRSSRNKEKKYRQPKVTASLDTTERSSVYNIYPPNPVMGYQRPVRCTSNVTPHPKLTCKGSTSGGSDSIYETISEVDISPQKSASEGGSCSSGGSLPHTYAVLERPLLPSDKQCASGVVTNSQVQEVVQAKPVKLEKRLSTKDNLTGQENEDGNLSEVDVPSEMETDSPQELSTTFTEDGMEDEMEEDVFQLEEVDSDHDLQVYRV